MNGLLVTIWEKNPRQEKKRERKKRSQKSINIFAFVIYEYQKDKFES